ncbi:MAG: hypothetical protein CL933_06200 [Deltaproteobacteria bacterium]|nr:hypothetical protein [Deltaproteobacteria bacterium]
MTRFESTLPTQPARRSKTSSPPNLPGDSARTTSAERIAKRSSRRKKARSSDAYLGLGASLGSARDRKRLRDRNAAERARVEQMLANAPSPLGSAPTPGARKGTNRHPAPLRTPLAAARARVSPSASRAPLLQVVGPRGCPVCASSKVVSDEVFQGGTMRLSECLHCDHRWTERPRGRWAELGATMSRTRSGARRPRTNRGVGGRAAGPQAGVR